MASRWLCALLVLAGCARTTLEKTAVGETRGDEMAFWDQVAKTRAISNHDALHALLLSFEIKTLPDYTARESTARNRGWIGKNEELPEKETARVGWIAKAVCIETGIKGGVTMRTFGPRERYAVEELNYRRWLANMTAQQSMSGMQLLALLSEAEDFVTGAPNTNPEDLAK